MEKNVGQCIVGLFVTFTWFFQPIYVLLIFTFSFMTLDFIIGIMASWSRLNVKCWQISKWWKTDKFWTWFSRTSLSAAAICMALALDIILKEFSIDFKLPYLATLCVCFASSISIAKNGAELAKWDLLKYISTWLIDLGKQVGEAIKRMIIRKIDNI